MQWKSYRTRFVCESLSSTMKSVVCLIGASLSEPHINGTAVHELYINIYKQGGSLNLLAPLLYPNRLSSMALHVNKF